MEAIIIKLHDQNGQEIGSILTRALGNKSNVNLKLDIESKLAQYADEELYPGDGIIIYRNVYVDTPSITVLKNINEIPNQKIKI